MACAGIAAIAPAPLHAQEPSAFPAAKRQSIGRFRPTNLRPAAVAQSRHQQMAEKLNQNTVTVISGNPNGTYLYLAYDLSAVLDDGDTLRILPIIGKGGHQNVKDILHLKGVDLGITQSNILRYLKRTGELGPNIDERLAYIAKLYNEEMHILAGAGIDKLEDLNGRKVNFSDAGSGTQFSARLILEHLGITCEEVNMGQAEGYLKVKSGEIAATVLIAGKPAGSFGKFKLEAGMKLLPVPYAEALEADYFPATLGHDDYPGLIKPGETVETVAVGAVLAVYNWPRDTDRYRRVARFVDALFTRLDDFKKPPRHAKWRETSLAASVRGWKRFPAAQEWLDRASEQHSAAAATAPPPPASPPAIDPGLARTQAARAAPSSAAEQEKLFQQFMQWARTQQRQ